MNWRIAVMAGVLGCAVSTAWAGPLPAGSPDAKQEAQRLDKLPALKSGQTRHLDKSGRNQQGKASFYAARFAHRKMADGRRMNPNANVAASKTLPLGSVVKVKNLENGRAATVQIEDRGPFVAGRVVDLSPKVGDQLGLRQKGIASVEVKPITLPQPDGKVALGAGAANASPEELHKAVEVTKNLTERKNTETAEK